MLNYLPSLKFVGDTLSVSALIDRVTLGNLPTNFGIVLDSSANTCQTHHATLTLEITALVGDACLRGSSL